MISVRNLRVDYDTTCAVDDLSFDVRPGETYGLIGPNGAGKTSTLRALAGLLQPTYGQILIDGVDMLIDRERAQQKIGFMPDFPPLYDDLLVWEFLDLFAASYRIPKAERSAAVEANLELVELAGKRGALCKELSRGMRQRLVLAKTYPHGRSRLKDILKRFTAQDGAVLISSHVLAEMNEFCTAVGIMQRGKMVVAGSLEEVAERVGRPDVLLVDVVSGGDILAQLAAARGGGPAVHQGGTKWEIPFDGDRDTAAELLAEAVSRGVRIASFAPRKDTLEDLFLQVGAKEVS
jgi:ABC-2 type transport system ATP-binding protein